MQRRDFLMGAGAAGAALGLSCTTNPETGEREVEPEALMASVRAAFAAAQLALVQFPALIASLEPSITALEELFGTADEPAAPGDALDRFMADVDRYIAAARTIMDRLSMMHGAVGSVASSVDSSPADERDYQQLGIARRKATQVLAGLQFLASQ